MPIEPKITIRRAQADDDAALQRFIAKTYGLGARFKGSDTWCWQFLRNPQTPDPDRGASMWLAFVGDDVVGQMGVQDCAIMVDGAHHHAGWIVDVMVDGDFRGKGVGHMLHAEIQKHRPILITLTMAEATRRIAQRAGCITLGPTNQWVRWHRLSGQTVARFLNYKSQYGRGRRFAITAFNRSWVGPRILAILARLHAGSVGRQTGALAGYNWQMFDEFSDEIDEFIRGAQSELAAVMVREPVAQTWRYNQHPTINYSKFLIRTDDGIKGILICRLPVSGELPAGVVTDVITRPDDPQAHDALLELAFENLDVGCEFLEAAASTPDMSNALMRAGYMRTRTMRPTIVCADETLKRKLDRHIDDWHFTKADHDWDQVHPV